MSTYEMIFFSLLIALITAAAAAVLLKKRYKKQTVAIFLFFFIMNIAIPFLGFFLSIWLLYYLLNVTYRPELHDFFYINTDEFTSEFPKVKRTFGESGVYALMKQETSASSMKLHALMSMADKMTRRYLEIIKYALSDQNDEVRLFSFSVIDKYEKKINEQINKNLQNYEMQKGDKKRNTAKNLAGLYWDLVYYELSDDVLRTFMVQESKRYVLYVLKDKYDEIDMHILLAKIFLFEKKFEFAAREFAFVLEWDHDRYSFMSPYLAQIYYYQHNYKLCKALLSRESDFIFNAKLAPIASLWQKSDE